MLGEQIQDQVRQALERTERRRSTLPTDLATQYIITTFMLVLNWWVESRSALSAREVDDVFLALVVPAVTSPLRHAEG